MVGGRDIALSSLLCLSALISHILTCTISPEQAVIHYHCVIYPYVPREHSSQSNKQCFHEETIKQILLYWIRNSPSYFPSPSPILLIFKVTMVKGFSDNVSREKNFSLSLTRVGGIYLFLVSLSPLLWERMLLFKKFTTKQCFRSKLSHEEHFLLFISPQLVFTRDGRKSLSGYEGRLDLEKDFTTGLLTRFHYFVCPELTHFLFCVLPSPSRSYPFFLFKHMVDFGVAMLVQV